MSMSANRNVTISKILIINQFFFLSPVSKSKSMEQIYAVELFSFISFFYNTDGFWVPAKNSPEWMKKKEKWIQKQSVDLIG